MTARDRWRLPGGLLVAIFTLASVLVSPHSPARADDDCMHSCMADYGCSNDYEAGTVSGYCQTQQGSCEVKCSRASASYGSIAYDAKTGQYGYSYNQDDQPAAERLAVRNCGTDGCQVAVTFANGCAALASGANSAYSVGQADTRQNAESKALAACGKKTKGCDIQAWSCAK